MSASATILMPRRVVDDGSGYVGQRKVPAGASVSGGDCSCFGEANASWGEVKSTAAMLDVISQLAPGSTAKFRFLRDGKPAGWLPALRSTQAIYRFRRA